MKIIRWHELTNQEQAKILSRPAIIENNELQAAVTAIINQVKNTGDAALKQFTRDFDGVKLDNICVTKEEMSVASTEITVRAKKAIKFAMQRIKKNLTVSMPETTTIKGEGVTCERQIRPIQNVGLYIPGGSAPLVSTVLMLGVPAMLAKCRNKILCSPPNHEGKIDPHILYAASCCGIEQIYKVGGAQAIAAMAYGSESILKVDKIFGPGNAWVTEAKIQISKDPLGAGIDMPAGPTELMIVADVSANALFIAADLLSQAEHGESAQVILITNSSALAKKVERNIKQQMPTLSHQAIINVSLQNARIIIVDDILSAIKIANRYAPEHLILQLKNAKCLINKIDDVGTVFLGEWSAEALGDYVTGANHVLPTYGYARHISGLSIQDFLKFINVQTVNKSGLKKIGPYAETLAEIEGLTAHKQAVTLRLAEVCK